MNEVKLHQTEGYMWTVLKGRVYNLSPYMKFHPGGEELFFYWHIRQCLMENFLFSKSLELIEQNL